MYFPKRKGSSDYMTWSHAKAVTRSTCHDIIDEAATASFPAIRTFVNGVPKLLLTGHLQQHALFCGATATKAPYLALRHATALETALRCFIAMYRCQCVAMLTS